MSRPRSAMPLAGFLAACASAPPAAPPAPFDADQIRAATPAGRTYVQRTVRADGPPVRTTIRFVEVDAAGATLEVSVEGGDGPRRSQATWSELAAHGRQPPGAARHEAPCEVPAGRFDCALYVVETPDGATRTSFALSLPGMPVRVERKVDDAWVTVSVVESHAPGGDGSP